MLATIILHHTSFKMTEMTVADTKPDKETKESQQDVKGKKIEDEKGDSSVEKEQKQQSQEGESDVVQPKFFRLVML